MNKDYKELILGEGEENSVKTPLRVLIACEYSATVRGAFASLGHDAWSCDLRESEKPGNHLKCDVREVLNDGWDLMVAHPVCTRLTNAGRRWLHNPPNSRTMVEMWRDFFDAVEFYELLRDAPIDHKAIENPIMHDHAKECLGSMNRQIVQPWWFGDRAFKATGWELFGLPRLKATDVLNPPMKGTLEHKEWSWVHRMPPGPDREKERSRFHPGMAAAIAEQWGSFSEKEKNK